MISTNRPLQCWIDRDLHRSLKVTAAQERTTVTAIVRDVIAQRCVRTVSCDAPVSAQQRGKAA